jgi:hypothetical protein
MQTQTSTREGSLSKDKNKRNLHKKSKNHFILPISKSMISQLETPVDIFITLGGQMYNITV